MVLAFDGDSTMTSLVPVPLFPRLAATCVPLFINAIGPWLYGPANTCPAGRHATSR